MCPDVNHFLKPRGPQNAEDIARQLRELPSELPPPYDWAEFNRRSRDRLPARRTLVKWPHAAAAATLMAIVAGLALLGSGSRPGGLTNGPEQPAVKVVAPAETNEMHAADTSPDSQATREWLARQPEPALVRVVPRIAVANLEDRIAWFDDAMTEERVHGANADYLQMLQQERARLVSSLAQVRYAESLVADGS